LVPVIREVAARATPAESTTIKQTIARTLIVHLMASSFPSSCEPS
jgi:hypothetical protein